MRRYLLDIFRLGLLGFFLARDLSASHQVDLTIE